MGHANYGWCKLAKHPDKKALTWFDEQQVDALIRDSWGDVGHLTVFVRRDDAAQQSREPTAGDSPRAHRAEG